MNSRLTPLLLAALAAGVLSCRGTARVNAARPGASLAPLDSFVLGSPAAGMCRDGAGLILLESSGERLIRLDSSLLVLDTIALSERVVGPRGVEADRFYIYVYDDHALRRMARDKQVLATWLGNVRVAGLAGFAPGEMLVSDETYGAIWYKTLFGESRRFVAAGDVQRPGAMVDLPDGLFGVIDGRRRLALVNRSGIVVRSIKLPADCDIIAAGSSGDIYVARRGAPVVWQVEGGPERAFALPGATGPQAVVALPDRLAVLDSDSRVRTFRYPGP
jgi:hypothetical protein